MPAYIPDVDTLIEQAGDVMLPPEGEIQAALRMLSASPVAGYAAFTEAEVRLLAAYRACLNRGTYDFVWRAFITNAPEAWVYAIHEAAEIQAFAERGINPFDRLLWNQYWEEPHLDGISNRWYLKTRKW